MVKQVCHLLIFSLIGLVPIEGYCGKLFDRSYRSISGWAGLGINAKILFHESLNRFVGDVLVTGFYFSFLMILFEI
jgi:hypothetical protein